MKLLSLIVQDKKNIDSYEKLLKNRGYKADEVFILDSKTNKINEELVIIDLSSKKGFELLESLFFHDRSFVIIISPISKKLIKLPKNLMNINIFYILKPIDIYKFDNLLESCSEKIDKRFYLKSKEQILVKTIDESPLKMAIYNLNGFLVYGNEPYCDDQVVECYEGFDFKNSVYCDLEFKDVVYNLKMKQLYTVEEKQNGKWYKSFFYLANDDKSITHLCIDETSDKLRIESLAKSAQFFEQSTEGAVITDSNGVILSINNSFCNITGYTKDEVIGNSTNILNSGTQDKSFYENMWTYLKNHGRWQGEIWNKRKNGEIYPEWLSITEIKDNTTSELNYMAIFTDITSLKEADKKLHFYANHDHLTGLLNKIQFENMLDQTINSAIRNNKVFALLFIDLDYFKDVNDTAGHSAGDLVLKEVARRFQKVVRKEDIIARIGGDEFTIIFDNITEESDAILLANKLIETIKKPFEIEGQTFYLSLSIGVSLFPYHGLNKNELSKNADSAMYEVKNNGRDGILLYDKRFTESLIKKVSLYTDLKKAVENQDFKVFYQLVVDIKTKKIIGAEALIRWEDLEKGFISPEEFIPIAEHHGFIEDIGKFVLTTACTDLPYFLNKFGNEFVLAVNISSKELAGNFYVENVLEIVNDFNVSTSNIELEITETYIMQNHIEAIEKMKKLKEKGFKLAIDDFGTGYSSLSYLKKFPINKVKIDKSFVLDMVREQDDKDMVEAIINIAKIFKLDIQVEGVETKEHVKILQTLGADIAQGYFYSKPLPLEKIFSKKSEFKL